MNGAERLDGIIAVPATPFTDSNLVEEESLRRYVSRSIGQGVTGFLAPVVAGEVDYLSVEERNLVVRTIIDEAAGRVPVIGGASDSDPRVRLAMGRSYLDLGCAGILAYLSFVDEASYVADVADLAKDLSDRVALSGPGVTMEQGR